MSIRAGPVLSSPGSGDLVQLQASEAAGAGTESPTVLLESEDGLLKGVLARVPSRLRPSGLGHRFPRLLT